MQSFWYDEALTLHLVEMPLGSLFRVLPDQETTPPLYYVLAWGWVRLFDASEFGLRSFSALLGTATIPVVYAAGRSLISSRAGIVAAGLAAGSPPLVWYSQEARSYALFIFLGALSFLFFARAATEATSGALAAWSIATALTVTTHYFAVFLAAAEAAWLVLAPRTRRTAMPAVGIVVAVGAALLPLATAQRRNVGIEAISGLGLLERMNGLVQQFALGFPDPSEHRVLLALPLLMIVLLGVVLWVEQHERSRVLIALAVGGATVVAPLALALAGLDVFVPRNVLVTWTPLAVALAAGMASRRAGWRGLTLAGALAALSVALVAATWVRPTLQRDNWRAVADTLRKSDARRVIVTAPLREDLAALELYWPSVEKLGPGGGRVNEVVLIGRGVRLSVRSPAGFFPVGTRRIGNLTVVRLRSLESRRVMPSALGRGKFGSNTSGVVGTGRTTSPRSAGIGDFLQFLVASR